MKNPIKGITGITNPNNLTGGTAAESDDSLRQRIDDLFAGRGDSYVGNKKDYERWAKEVAGVGFAHCIPVYAGANTVKVVIMDANGEPANQEICKAVELHIFGTGRDDINRLAPIGIVQYEISPPILTEINYSFDLKLKENFTVEIVQKNFREALRTYYGELVESDGSVEPVVYVHISAILSKVAGVADFKHLRINGKIGNVIFNARNLNCRAVFSFALNAVALALIFMITDERTDDAQRIIFKEHAPRLHRLTGKKQANHFGNICFNRTTFDSAEWFFALQTSPSLFDNVCSHN